MSAMKKVFLLFAVVVFSFYKMSASTSTDNDRTETKVSRSSVIASTSNLNVIGASSASTATSSGGSTLVYYPFSTDLNYTSLSPSISAATLSFSNLTSAYIADDGFGNVLEAYPAAGATNYASAVSNNSYFTLTLDAVSVVSMDNLVFEVGKGGSSDPRGYFVRSSVDGFTNDLISEVLPAGSASAPVSKSIPLGSEYDGISGVIFRFYIFSPTPVVNSVDWSNISVESNSSVVPVSIWSIVTSMLLIILFTLYRIHKKRRIALKA